jgi:hypothetical protein
VDALAVCANVYVSVSSIKSGLLVCKDVRLSSWIQPSSGRRVAVRFGSAALARGSIAGT